MSEDIKILVAAHKSYWMPADSVYMPIHVGAEGKASIGFTGDNTGDNISLKNPNYCELTGLYWAWKNFKSDYIGLCHYRRYFCKKSYSASLESKQHAILTGKDFEKLLENVDCIVPTKRNYYIETVKSQYEHAHRKKDLDELQHILEEFYPEYMVAYNTVMSGKRLHILNMFVMKWDLFDAYCTFLFDVLDKLETRIDISGYSVQEARVFGFLSERLLNVWLIKNEVVYKEVPVVFLEGINWFKKGISFVARKFGRSHSILNKNSIL